MSKLLNNTQGPSDTPHIVFVQDGFYLGGIEVLETKLAKELSAIGCKVTITCNANAIMDHSAGEFDLFIHHGYPHLIKNAYKLFNPNSPKTILVTLHPTAAMAALMIGSRIREGHDSADVRIFQWVSHSRAFFFSRRFLVKYLLERAFKMLPKRSTYFMNDAARMAHECHWESNLEEYPIIKITGREANHLHSSRAAEELRIVSVGRLVPFKSYNTHAPVIVRELMDHGLNISWDIWGYGPDEASIRNLIQECDVGNSVRLCGSLAHDDFDLTVSRYDLFIGMGTSVLEAAKTMTPSIVALENGDSRCYGFLYETPSDSVGDLVPDHPQMELIDCVRRFHGLSESERSQIGMRCAQAASSRESPLQSFVQAVLASESVPKIKAKDRIFFFVANLYLQSVRIKKIILR